MIFINKKEAYNNAEHLKNDCNSTEILLESLAILMPNKTNFIRKLLFIILEIGLAYIVCVHTDTIVLTKDIISILLSTMLALTAIVFTGYAFFQALINDVLLVTLMSIDIKADANLYNTNKYFAKLMIFQIVCLFFNIFLIIILMVLSNINVVILSKKIRDSLALVGISLILYVNFEGMWEMKSFIFNIFQLFNLHSYSRLVNMKKKEINK